MVRTVENKNPAFSIEKIKHYPFHKLSVLRIIYVVKGSIEINNVGGNILLS